MHHIINSGRDTRSNIDASCDHWVVYSEPADSICVEPQSEPPDFVNLRAEPTTAGPGS